MPEADTLKILCNAADGKSVQPAFGKLFLDEPLPENGQIQVSQLDKPGFGLTLNPAVKLIDASLMFSLAPQRSLGVREVTEENQR